MNLPQDTKEIVVQGAFDDLRSSQVRFLQEASSWGPVHVLLWSDQQVQDFTGKEPKFPLEERSYFLQAIRFVSRVHWMPAIEDPDVLPNLPGLQPSIWLDEETTANQKREAFCRRHAIDYRALPANMGNSFPLLPPMPSNGERRKVVVTGCYDWLHTGHIRFFQEVSALGDLYAIVGKDENIRLLKGEGHPLFSQEERRYMVGSIRYVKTALICSGDGWVDADPEIRQIRPDIYAVNEDGDKGGKREYCRQRGIEYHVLKRTPAPGLQARSSTTLRGF